MSGSSLDREPAQIGRETLITRLTIGDRSKSIALAGTREGMFRVVYVFENKQLLEIINRTVHTAALSALVVTASTYRFYFGIYVRSVSRFTPIYMALIDPFRQLIVYPSLLRAVLQLVPILWYSLKHRGRSGRQLLAG